jgi:hypothetical protein
MEDVSEETLDDLDIEFTMDEQTLDEGTNRRSNKDRQFQSRRRIEELMEQKRLKMQLGDFDDYDFPTEH